MKGFKHFVLVCALIIFSQSVFAATISPGDLIISEVMVNPSSAVSSDTNGEWFELRNLTANSIDLNGVSLSDDGSNHHVINNDVPLIINPFGYLVFGRSADQSLNGGYIPDYVYSRFVLSNSGDEIVLSSSGVEIVRLEYSEDFDVSGRSMELVGSVSLSLSDSNFVQSKAIFGSGDFGTPGGAGSSNWNFATQPVPVPATVWLLISGLIGLLRLRN